MKDAKSSNNHIVKFQIPLAVLRHLARRSGFLNDKTRLGRAPRRLLSANRKVVLP